MDKGGRSLNITNIIRRQEKLAFKMLDKALDTDVGIDIQLDVFDRVSRYLAVKNRIADGEETDIDRFKARIHGSETKTVEGRKPRSAPERLEGIKSKLSGRDVVNSDGDIGSSSGSISVVVGGDR